MRCHSLVALILSPFVYPLCNHLLGIPFIQQATLPDKLLGKTLAIVFFLSSSERQVKKMESCNIFNPFCH